MRWPIGNSLLRIASLWRRPEKSLDIRGEDAAARYLKRKGYRIIERRSRTFAGELDIVAVDGRTVVFVEVKTRRSDAAGTAAEAVDTRKQQQLSRVALGYLRRRGLLECKSRFDVVAVTWPDDAKKPVIQHFINAFEPAGVGQLFS